MKVHLLPWLIPNIILFFGVTYLFHRCCKLGESITSTSLTHMSLCLLDCLSKTHKKAR